MPRVFTVLDVDLIGIHSVTIMWVNIVMGVGMIMLSVSIIVIMQNNCNNDIYYSNNDNEKSNDGNGDYYKKAGYTMASENLLITYNTDDDK